jgi:hypothetical protein
LNEILFGFFLFVVTALFVLAAATAAACACQDKNAQEQEAICNEKEIIEVSDAKKFIAGEEANNAGKHQQSAENTGSPSEIIDYCNDFHFDWFW